MYRGTEMHRDLSFDGPAANDGPSAGASTSAPARELGATPAWAPLVPMDLPGFVRLVDWQLRHSRRQGQRLAVLALRVVHIESDAAAEVPAELEADLLRELGQRLRMRVRASDSVAWLGGGEFGVVLLNVIDAQASQVAGHLKQVLGSPYRLGEARLTVRLAIGSATRGTGGGQGGAELIEQAAKGLGA
jgi:GGDEF domain-containing protein